jgi:GPI mannosyltransferase 4
MFALSFVLEDWALHELVSSPRHRRVAVLLVASSYVTWTYQTHTFSNSIETLAVAWSLVLIDRIVENKVRRLCCRPRYMLRLYSNDLLPLLQLF